MKKKILFFLLAAFCLFLLCACVEESPEPIFDPSSIKTEDRMPLGSEEQNGIVYTLFNDKTCHVSAIEKENITSLALKLPAYYGDYKVIAIDPEVFRESDFTHITLPEGLKTIGRRAFKNAVIKEIALPNSVVSIGEECFDNCLNLESVTFGTGLKEIPLGAFSSCRKLTKLSLPDGIEKIGEEAFSSLVSLESLTLPSSLREIGPYAFFSAGTDSLSIAIPSKVEKIEKGAFLGTAFLKNNTEEFFIVGKGVLLAYHGNETSLTLPSHVSYLSNAFDKTTVESLILNETLAGICEDALTDSNIKTLSYNGNSEEIKAFVLALNQK